MNSLSIDKWIDFYVLWAEISALTLLLAASALAGMMALNAYRRTD